MKKIIKKVKGKKVLSVLLALIMVLTVASPAFSPIIARAASQYPVELGFNNLFIFEEWASDENSTSVVFGGTKDVGTLTADIQNGSFRLTKTSTEVPQAYTGHGESRTNSVSNTDYYMIPVEPNTVYSFSYNLQGNVPAGGFSPFVFMFDSNSLLKTFYDVAASGNGDNSFMFITPADVTQVQLRFTISNDGTPYADVRNIALTKCDVTLGSTNLFNFDSWADNAKSRVPASDFGYDDGTIVPDKSTKTITMTTNNGSSTSGNLFSSFSFANNSGYYNIDVAPNTSYVFNYSIVDNLNSEFVQFTPYFVRNRADGSFIDYIPGSAASGYGPNTCIFTTTNETEYISVVLSIAHNNTNWVCTLKDIELFEATEVKDNKVSPHRLLKTYGVDATYGTLPTPTAPDNYVFAGWNTKADGTGMRIAADTPVQPRSYTVYPKFEPAVDSLTVVTQPVKKVYTVGEKLDTTGLVLQATINNTNGDEGATSTFNVASGYYCTPEVLNTVGTHTITAHYGGKTATFTVTVKSSDPGTVIVNGASKDVTIANNEYTFNYSTSAFNRYEVTYKSDSYVSGVATFNDGKTEEFFLEPSDNGSFGSYVDKFLESNTYNQIVKIKFTTLDKDNGKFELISLNTASVADPGDTVFFKNDRYEMGVSLKSGGVVSELYDLGNDVYARTYANGSNDITQIDYLNKLNENYGSGYKQQSNRVNLINTLDQGRYLQQSYYGTGDKPYVESEYNNAPWPYNPVQGGNVIGEASKIIDYKVTDEYVYVKARPLDWAKWSDEYAATDSRYEAEWGDSYITDTYVEAWYYFQGDTIKVTNRKVDYSGLPEASHSQEYPALYLVEPLNHFVYNNVSAQDAWKTETSQLYSNYQFIDYTDNNRVNHWKATHQSGKLINYEEPEYWGLTELYKNELGMQNFEPWVTVNENWAAFTASEDSDSFGVGIYTDVTNKFYYGVQPTMYKQTAGDTEGSVGSVDKNTPEYRHAQTINPSPELPTSYIAPTDTALFKSYDPTEFTYYLTTGTATEIRDEFKAIYNNDAAKEAAKPKFAVPETVYLTPDADGKYTDGQYYVNNVMNKNNYYQLETTTEKDYMYMGFHVEGAKHFKVNLTNVDEPGNDVIVSDRVKGGSYENIQFDFDATDTVEFYDNVPLGLHFSGEGLDPGEIATVRWDITVIYDDGTEEVFTAYTVMYAPQRTVGAVAEARQIDSSQNEISSWITGANGVDHTKQAPLGSLHADKRSFGYFKQDPLVYTNPPQGGSGETPDDYTNTGSSSDDYYVMQAATNGHDSSRAQSYLGLLTIDKSRYTNTNQIPNLKIGFDALRIGSWTKDSMTTYKAYYTLGTIESFTSTDLKATPSGWTEFINENEYADSHTLPDRRTIVPEYKVSEIDGKYLHALNQGAAKQDAVATRYSTAGTSVLIDVTDKSALRESVTDGYGVKDPNPEFLEKLEEAATILGDPSATQEEIDLVQKELDDSLKEILNILYALKYDNLFSIYEFSQHPSNMEVTNTGTATYNDKTLTVVNGTITGGEAYTKYGSGNEFYKVELKPNTEYVFEYDVTTDVKSQAFMFFYNSNNENSEAPTNISVQTNGGAWQSKSESNSWWGNYGNAGTYHYVIKFTTGATTTQAGFRFGNTSNDPTTSTFSNIKLIDAERYYADVEYTSVEDRYVEYSSYGALPVLTRPGYTFNGWKDADGKVVTGSNVATKHESIFSQWSINKYTITYNANGGSVSPTSQTYTVNDVLNIPMPTRAGYNFQGWTVTSAEGRWELNGICTPGEVPAGMYGNVTLTAQWALGEIPVYFDTILDFSKWNTTTASNATISNVTDNGFTLTSNAGVGEGTSSSPYFAVEPGETYEIDIDITGDNWDVYIFFCNENGDWIDFGDGTNRYSSNGGGVQSREFTAPDKAEVVKAQIRVDANGSSNSVTFSDIRVYVANTCASNVYVPDSNKVVKYGEPYGDLPVPTRPGYKFDGWKNVAGQWVKEGDPVNTGEAVYLYSQWTENVYTVNYSANGPVLTSPDSVTKKYSETITLPDELVWADGEFIGWSLNQTINPFATEGIYDAGTTINVKDIPAEYLDPDEDGTLVLKFNAVWKLKDSAIVDDTVVSDFSLPIKISPYEMGDSDVLMYHVTSICTDWDVSFTNGGNGDYGTFSIDGAYVTYTPNQAMNGADEVEICATLYYSNTDATNATKLYSTVTVVPASNVYYEETAFAKTAGTGTVAWSTATDGTSTDYRNVPDAGDVYGFDNAYDNTNTYSNGTTLSASVDTANKRSKTATVSFTGDGIDIISACGPTTGLQIVNIKDASTGKSVSAGIVDTYYDGASFSQVPIFNWRGAYGTYILETTAVYLSTAGALKNSSIKNNLIDTGLVVNSSDDLNTANVEAMLEAAGVEDIDAENIELIWFDDNSILNGGTGVAPTKKGSRAGETKSVTLNNYLDGFRIYNPLGSDSSAYAESEKNASYVNVINNLAPVSDSLNGIGFITGNLAEGEILSFANYESVGPNDEFYLLGKQGLTFKIKVNAGEKVMLGLRAVNGESTINISSDKSGYVVQNVAIKSATEMFYDITDCLGTISADGTEVQITVTNSGANMVAINQVKLSGGTKVNDENTPVTRSIARSGDTATQVSSSIFLPLTAEDLLEVENGITTKEAVNGEVVNGVIMPIIEDEGDEPDAPEGEEPDAPEGDEPDAPEGDEPDAPEGDEPDAPEGDEPDAPEGDEPDAPEGDEPDAPEGDEPDAPEGDEPDAPEGDEPDAPDDGDNNGGESGDDSSSSGGVFDIFSLIKMIIEIIKNILFNTVGNAQLV